MENTTRLFLTEDGKEIFDATTVLYGVGEDFTKREMVAGEYSAHDKLHYKWFSNEAARDGWIDWCMPVITLTELKDLGTLSPEHVLSIPWPKLKGFIMAKIEAHYKAAATVADAEASDEDA